MKIRFRGNSDPRPSTRVLWRQYARAKARSAHQSYLRALAKVLRLPTDAEMAHWRRMAEEDR